MSAQHTPSEQAFLDALAAAPDGLTRLDLLEELNAALNNLVNRGVVNRDRSGKWPVYTLATKAAP